MGEQTNRRMSTHFITKDRPAPTSLDRAQRCLTSVVEISTECGPARVSAITYIGEVCSGLTQVIVMVPGVWDSKLGRPTTVRTRFVRTREVGLRVAQRVADYVAARYGEVRS